MTLTKKPSINRPSMAVLDRKVQAFETEMKILKSQLDTVTREYHFYLNALALEKLKRGDER